jgi:hypothetical protein
MGVGIKNILNIRGRGAALTLALIVNAAAFCPKALAQTAAAADRATSPSVLEQRVKPKQSAPREVEIPLPHTKKDADDEAG